MNYAEESLKKHYEWKGKVEVVCRTPLETSEDLSLAYTPGVAQPCLEIQKDVQKSYDLTRRSNLVAVVTDGTAVLGLGDIGPEAGMPVMEGKCALFKAFGDVDAIPLCIRSKEVDDIVNTVRLIAGSFGGINLEDISAPRCFEIEKKLKECCDIPIFHDDQHGTAVVCLAAMLNALKLTGKKIDEIRVVTSGAGAAGIAIIKLLISMGLKDVVLCDRKGAIYKGRDGLNPQKEEMAEITNQQMRKGSLAEVIKGADVFIGVSSPGCVTPDMVIGYDSNCRYCFEVLAKKAPHIKRVMDNAAPNRNYLCKVYTDNRDACGPFADALAPYKYLFDPENARWYSEEIKTVQYHIVASGFSKKALEYEGVSLDHIFVIPYGIDESRFMNIERTYEEGKLNLIFIGEVNQRKGIYQICEAAKKLNNPNIEFNIVGSGYEAQKELFAPYTKYVTFHGTAYFEKMQKHLEHNQVLLFPSMGDGFGFVVLEAMAAGMPVIASYNSAGPDVIKDGDNGFLIESCNTDALVDRVSWFLCNMDKVKSMGQRAQESAKCYTWVNYNTLIIESVKTILMQHE